MATLAVPMPPAVTTPVAALVFVSVSVPPFTVAAPLTVFAVAPTPVIVTVPVKVLSNVIEPIVRLAAEVTSFVGVPEKSASLLLVQAAVPESQFSAEVSQTPLFVPDQICVAAGDEEMAATLAPIKTALAAR
jgi:hypothetical protein